ncbi:MAG: NAD-dependent epimerase/dehydratase family protein [Verrucomicrobiota bacterium]|jgi:NAD(P)-dependent dehydrogenase (short-subunit alcohol dehydrogenase family)
MGDDAVHAITGAFGYSGRYIATRLLGEGCRVITLTNSPARANPFGDQRPDGRSPLRKSTPCRPDAFDRLGASKRNKLGPDLRQRARQEKGSGILLFPIGQSQGFANLNDKRQAACAALPIKNFLRAKVANARQSGA